MFLITYTVLPNKQFGHIIGLASKSYLHDFGQRRGRISFYQKGEKQPASGPHIECYKHNSFLFQFDKLKHLVDEPQNLIKQNCDQFEKLGEYGFQNA